jgi:hypothetical protein
MVETSSVRVIFYYNSTSAFERASEVEKLPATTQEAFRRALSSGERLLRQGLGVVFREVTYLTLVQAATKLSSPQGLRALAGTTIIVSNPDSAGLQLFLEAYARPENESTEVNFFKAFLDAGLKLVLEPIPYPKGEEENS